MIKIVFIAGAGRSGSTILGRVLGEIPGFYHVGELYSFWPYSWQENRRCGCGVRIRECTFWGSIVERLSDGKKGLNARGMADSMAQIPRTVEYLYRSPKSICRANSSGVLGQVEGFYDEICETTGAQWIVDSSKLPAYSLLLGCSESIEVHVLHLVRDIRGVCYSWSRKAIDGWRPSLRNQIVKWAGRNAAVEYLSFLHNLHIHRVKYEDFAQQPRKEVQKIMEWLDMPPESNPVSSEGTVELNQQHTAWGNPGRMKTGEMQIRCDNAWRNELDTQTRRMIELWSWPMLWRYSYIGA